MKVEYLNDVPKEDEWIAFRKLQWSGQGDKKGLSPTQIQGPRDRIFKSKDDSKSEIEAYENYFIFGDVQEFVKKSKKVKK
ncbi:MAG: hypothetical protein HRU20_17310 [Pseudomonadales bacterium]|nr:hypothetical protein [Pseudomonadales bacterium]